MDKILIERAALNAIKNAKACDSSKNIDRIIAKAIVAAIQEYDKQKG